LIAPVVALVTQQQLPPGLANVTVLVRLNASPTNWERTPQRLRLASARCNPPFQNAPQRIPGERRDLLSAVAHGPPWLADRATQ